jgi:Calcium-binding EGF domain
MIYVLANCFELFVDIDECEETKGICGIGKCKNTEGNFTCICPPGHQLLPDNTCVGKLLVGYLQNTIITQIQCHMELQYYLQAMNSVNDKYLNQSSQFKINSIWSYINSQGLFKCVIKL